MPNGEESSHGECRPALVTYDWNLHLSLAANVLNLVVFHNLNDRPRPAGYTDAEQGLQWVSYASHSDRHLFGSWHYPEECRHAQKAEVTV